MFRQLAATVVMVSDRALIREKPRSQPLSRIGPDQPCDACDGSIHGRFRVAPRLLIYYSNFARRSSRADTLLHQEHLSQ
jgi:hypothetical protein